MVTALAPYAIAFGVVGTMGIVLATFWGRITAPLAPAIEQYRLALEQADVSVGAEELLLAILGGGTALWILLILATRFDPIRGSLLYPIALTVAAYTAQVIIERKKRKRLAAFGDQLELVLRLMASGLRAGLGLRQAIVLVIDELEDPARKEFMRVVGQSNIGLSIHDALDGLARRMPLEETAMMVRAIRVQSQTGGNLAKVLEHLAGTIKERRRVHRKMRSLTAEGRMTAWVISLLPVIVAVMIMAIEPGMRGSLLLTTVGHVVIAVVVVLEAIGVVVLRRIMRFEV
jgi:tight adherence protein B